MSLASMPRCADEKPLSDGSWHWAQISLTGWSARRGCDEACGLWQVEQSLAGWCCRSAASLVFMSLWHVKQTSGDCATISAFSADLCGLWHFVHSPLEKAACTLFAPSACLACFWWHLKQSVFSSVTTIPGLFEPCASWQSRQLPEVNGLCAVPLASPAFSSSAWQPWQSFTPASLRSFAFSEAWPPWQAWH